MCFPKFVDVKGLLDTYIRRISSALTSAMLDSMGQRTRAQRWRTGTMEHQNAGTLEYIILERQNTSTETWNTKLLKR